MATIYRIKTSLEPSLIETLASLVHNESGLICVVGVESTIAETGNIRYRKNDLTILVGLNFSDSSTFDEELFAGVLRHDTVGDQVLALLSVSKQEQLKKMIIENRMVKYLLGIEKLV